MTIDLDLCLCLCPLGSEMNWGSGILGLMGAFKYSVNVTFFEFKNWPETNPSMHPPYNNNNNNSIIIHNGQKN